VNDVEGQSRSSQIARFDGLRIPLSWYAVITPLSIISFEILGLRLLQRRWFSGTSRSSSDSWDYRRLTVSDKCLNISYDIYVRPKANKASLICLTEPNKTKTKTDMLRRTDQS